MALKATREPHFTSVDDLETESFLEHAAFRKVAMRSLNSEAGEGSVTYYAEEQVRVVNEGESPDVDREVTSWATCPLLVD